MIADHYSEILQNVFIKYKQISFAYLFGSTATGQQTALSDVDIAVYLRKSSRFSFDDTLSFHGDCCRVLKRNDVDVLILNTTKNLILLEDIIHHGHIIYNIDSMLLNDFELRTLHIASDFRWQRLREVGV